MQTIRKTMSMVSGLAVLAAFGGTPAVAQVPSLAPSRIGGTLATRGDGTLVMAVRDGNGTLSFAERSGNAGAGWTKWDAWRTQVGGSIVTAPVLLMASNSNMVVLGRGTDNVLYYRQEIAPGNKVFDAWVRISPVNTSGSNVPAFTGRPAMVRRSGLLEIYATDVNGTVWESVTTSSSSVSWSPWKSLGTPGVALRNSPVLAMMNNGAYLLFAAGTNNHLYALVQSTSGAWGGWTDLGGAVASGDAIAAGLNSNGRVSVFINNTSGTISLKTQTGQNTSSWTATWATLPGTVTGTSRPAVVVQGDGRLGVFFWSANTRSVYWEVQTAASGTSWTNWVNLQSSTSGPVAVISDPSGVIHFVVLDNSGYIYERAQSSANSSSWIQWQAGYLGGPFAAP